MLKLSKIQFLIGLVVCFWAVNATTSVSAQAPKQTRATIGYEAARYHPIHNAPNVAKAENSQCLGCHQDILHRPVLATSPAGVAAADSKAWYQTLDTYSGPQQTFHQRHLTSDFAKQVMDLKCNFCHLGNDPREEAVVPPTAGQHAFTLRKTVNPSTTCLRCHGSFPVKLMEGVEGDWPTARKDLEDEDTLNGCLSCHEETFRTVRHQVNYLKASAIEKLAKGSSDVCYGCHGGRAWYRNSYPYPRHAWPDMPDEMPEWAKDRPKQSDIRFTLPKAK